MIKNAVLLFALMGQFSHEPPAGPATKPYPDFPLKVHVLNIHWNRIRGDYEGFGRANLLGTPTQGLDYNFECGEPFLHNALPDEYYQAHWKKPGQKLEILMQKVGSEKLEKCELKVTVKDKPYGVQTYAGPAPTAPPHQ